MHKQRSRFQLTWPKRVLLVILLIVIAGCLVPEPRMIPVAGAKSGDWHKETFWYEPWGSSGVHKGVDIFAQQGTDVIAPNPMLVVYQGQLQKGGIVVLGLGPKWRLHYFAHLAGIDDELTWLAEAGQVIGAVGDTGNAKGKPAHLHYSIVSLLPYPWLIDGSTQGVKKAVFFNPIAYWQ